MRLRGMALWHPRAKRIPVSTGPFISAPPRLVWHCTSGPPGSGQGAISTLRSHGSEPHFLLDPRTGLFVQFIPVNQFSKALVHGSVETNRAHAIQVELVGMENQSWTNTEYRRIADLARWIEQNAGVPRRAISPWSHARLSGSAWLSFSGHCGHQHVPGNDHVDPGNAFKINLVLGASLPKHQYASRTLKPGSTGTDVRRLQAFLNKRLTARKHSKITADGDYGKATEKAKHFITYALGFPVSVVHREGATPRVQHLIRHPDKRPKAYLERAKERKAQENNPKRLGALADKANRKAQGHSRPLTGGFISPERQRNLEAAVAHAHERPPMPKKKQGFKSWLINSFRRKK